MSPAQTRRSTQRPAGAGEAKIPPYNLEAERGLLGAMMLSQAAIGAAIEAGVNAADLYRPAHQVIYQAIRTLDSHGEAVDAITVLEQLRRDGTDSLAGGLDALTAIQADTPATSNAGRYARIVVDLAQLRALIAAGGEITQLGYEPTDDVAATVGHAESVLYAVGERRLSNSMITLPSLVELGLDKLEALYGAGSAITGLPTGFKDLDTILAGMQPGDLIVLGARPAVGKSALALDIARHVALVEHRPVLFFSLEMSAVQLANRMFASQAGIDLRAVRTGQLNERQWEQLSRALGGFDGPLLVDCNRDLTIAEIRAKARRVRSQHKDLGLVIIDYLQLMRSETTKMENRQLEVSQISRGCKILAGELDVPVIALSQVSRAVEARADKRPTLADLRESGALEADADVVLLMYRDDQHNPASPDKGVAEIIVAKQRNGETGTVRLAFREAISSFANLARR